MRRSRPPVAAVLLAAALALNAVGCDGTGAADPPPTVPPLVDPSPTPTPTPTSTPTPTPTPDNPWGDPLRGAPPPELDLVGHDDPWRIVQSHREFRGWLFKNPNPDLSLEINHPECPCHEAAVRLLSSYQEEDLWWTGGEAELVDVEVLDAQHPDLRNIRVTIRREEPSLLVDDTGNVHRELPPREIVEDWIFVRDDADLPWLLRHFVERERRDLTEEETNA